MKAALLKDKPRYPTEWSQLPNGALLRSAIEKSLEETSRRLFGYYLVRLGNLSSQTALTHCPIKYVVNQTEQPDASSHVISTSRALPFLENSVDAFLLAHELDFAQDPHQILREVDRTITPSGYVIITGFNPCSAAGVFKYLPINRKNILHDARFFSSGRIKDWLNLLSFEVVEHQHLVFSELFFERKFNPEGRWYKRCQKYLSFCSSIYILVAKKRVMPMSIIKPAWKPKPRFSAIGASMKESA